MVFSSILFLFRFLPLVLLCYYMVPSRWRNFVLFVCSLIFYAWGEPVYVCLMLFSTLTDYILGRMVGYFQERKQQKKAKLCVGISAVVNLSLLGFFKYTDFFITTWNQVANHQVKCLELALPIGISFYTFQTMSYTIDVYRGDAPVQKNIINFGAYVSLFPQLIAGPIVRYHTIAEQLNNRRESVDEFAQGVLRFVTGLGKKVCIANNVGLIWKQVSAMSGEQLSLATAWLGIFAFALQIYFDFSGYSDMAIGLGHMFGFRFLENFHYPYESKSITEFWKRWHISLGTWFREYVYIPLGGNRRGIWKQLRNLFIVWFLTGFWHGASWNFILWGLYFGVILAVEKFLLKGKMEYFPNFVKHLYVLLLVAIGWCIFTYSDMADGVGYIQALLGINGQGIVDHQFLYLLYSNAVLFLLAVIGSTSLVHRAGVKIQEKSPMLYTAGTYGWMIIVLLLSIAYLVDASYNPFLYFRF